MPVHCEPDIIHLESIFYHVDAKPSLDLLLDHSKVILYCEWLHQFYDRGSTARNKCQHLASFLHHLEGVSGIGDEPRTHSKIVLCLSIFNEHAQTAKVKAIRQRASLANEDQRLQQGTIILFMIPIIDSHAQDDP